MKRPMNNGDRFAMTIRSARPANARRRAGQRRDAAATPAPRNAASARDSSGMARGVERRARPDSVSVNALKSEPYGDGSSRGCDPTETTSPTSATATKKRR